MSSCIRLVVREFPAVRSCYTTHMVVDKIYFATGPNERNEFSLTFFFLAVIDCAYLRLSSRHIGCDHEFDSP